MGKSTAVGEDLLRRKPCAIDTDKKSAVSIAHVARYTFASDETLVSELDRATTRDDVTDALARAYNAYQVCLQQEYLNLALKIKTFMHKHNLPLE